MPTLTAKIDRRKFDDDGYLILPSVFEQDEAAAMAAAVDEPQQPSGDLLCKRGLADLVWDHRVLEVYRALTDADPVYFGFSSANIATTMKPGSWHRDNADRVNTEGPDWQSPYTVIRFGVYLEDHQRHSGGLNIRARSHLSGSARSMRVVYAATKPGDLVVWNMRIRHSGFGYRLKFPAAVPVAPTLGKLLPGLVLRPALPRRRVLFVSYGADDHHTERYISYLKTRTFMVNLWRASHVPERVAQQLAAAEGVGYRDMPNEIRSSSSELETTTEHHDPPVDS